MSPITSVQIYSDDEIEATADRSSFGGRTKTKRESSKNKLTVQYGTKYRDPDNTRELMGKLQPLGKAFAKYLKSLLQAALISMRTDLPNAARSYAQSYVFAIGRQDAETQRHLGLQMGQSVMDQ